MLGGVTILVMHQGGQLTVLSSSQGGLLTALNLIQGGLFAHLKGLLTTRPAILCCLLWSLAASALTVGLLGDILSVHTQFESQC